MHASEVGNAQNRKSIGSVVFLNRFVNYAGETTDICVFECFTWRIVTQIDTTNSPFEIARIWCTDDNGTHFMRFYSSLHNIIRSLVVSFNANILHVCQFVVASVVVVLMNLTGKHVWKDDVYRIQGTNHFHMKMAISTAYTAMHCTAPFVAIMKLKLEHR